MSFFKPFERDVVTELVSPHLDAGQIGVVLDSTSDVSLERTRVGYFVTIRHSSLPKERIVCSSVGVIGSNGDIDVGFVVFIEDGELTLVCFCYGNETMPDDFREQQINIK